MLDDCKTDEERLMVAVAVIIERLAFMKGWSKKKIDEVCDRVAEVLELEGRGN